LGAVSYLTSVKSSMLQFTAV